MARQQDIFLDGFENHPPMLSKDDYVQWSLQYKQVLEPGDDTVTPPVPDTYKLQTNIELFETKQKQVEAVDQAIHILLLGLPTNVYAAMDSCQTANEM
ncbi:hypothetical protein Tco_0616563 [Tanacetum coccineum]